MQTASVNAVTDANGYLTFDFPNPVGQVSVSVNTPQSGLNTGVIGASSMRVGAKSVRIRVWVSGPDWTVIPANKKRVEVTLTAAEPSGVPPVIPPDPDKQPLYTLSKLDRSETLRMPSLRAGSNDGGATVRQEVWNPDSALRKQFTEVWSPRMWQTTINAAEGNTAVNSYPDVSSLVTTVENKPVPFANYESISSSWSVDCHANPKTNAQAAYDIWLNNYGVELMIWVDTHGANLGREPAGNDTGLDVEFSGATYRLWADGNEIFSFVRKTNAPVGSIDLKAVIGYLIDHGYIPTTSGVNMFTFGFETPSTGGVDEVFQVKDYTLVTTAKPGKVI